MDTFLLFWIGAGIVFLIIELVTSAFYGFSLAIAAFVVAAYVFFTHPTAFDAIQWIIFVVIAMLCSYFLPKWLSPKNELLDKPQGLDMYIGEHHRVKKVWEDFKVYLDGVQYFLVSDDEIQNNDLVEIVDRRGSVFIGEKIK